jgi:hypothetical protein
MTKDDFAVLFKQAVNLAAGRDVFAGSWDIEFELHGAGHCKRYLDFEGSLDTLYINQMKFYRFIDLMVKKFDDERILFFCVASGHDPVEFQLTFDPKKLGPFKVLSTFDG